MIEEKIVINSESYGSKEPGAILQANIFYLNSLFGMHVNYDEVPEAALQSYFVDYFDSQISNGGLVQFVLNSGLKPDIFDAISRGFQAMGAVDHQAFFDNLIELLNQQSTEQMQAFFDSPPWTETEVAVRLKEAAGVLYDSDEDLTTMNYAWLMRQENIVVLDECGIHSRLQDIEERFPILAERRATEQEEAPRYAQLIEMLCQQAGHTLVQITMGDPCHVYNGDEVLSWFFVTDEGLFFMVDYDDHAIMVNEETNEIVSKVETSVL